MYKTENAKVTLIMTKHPLVVLFLEYPNSCRSNKKSLVMSFNLTKPNDICQLQQLANITGTAYGHFLDLDQKSLRLVLKEDPKQDVKAIGSARKNEFFRTDGNGSLMTEAEVYEGING